jgi:hypothetical protein
MLAQKTEYRDLCLPSNERPLESMPGEIDKAGKMGYNGPRGGEGSMVNPTQAPGWLLPCRSNAREAPASTGVYACADFVLSPNVHSWGGT